MNSSLIIVTDCHAAPPAVTYLDEGETQVILTHDYGTPEVFELAVPYEPDEMGDLADRPQSAVIILNHEEAYHLYLILHELFQAHRHHDKHDANTP